MVIKSATAHIFHVGDSRIYQLRDGVFEQLTHDHRVWVSPDQSYLSRAMGINPQLEIDYRTLQVEEGDIYVLSTDGVYEFADANCILASISCCGGHLDQAARSIAEQAYRQGSPTISRFRS